MAARLDTVAKYLCEASDWQLSNLALQKMLYMSQMYYMGKCGGERLVDTHFEAWDYGPVSPPLYHRAKAFGSDPLKNIFFEARRFTDSDPRKAALDEVCKALLDKTPGELVDITHWERGAWAKRYVPKTRGIRIPEGDILQEYNDRIAA